ncbi:LysR family transcriptional regulator [Eubacterium maltosivorans]|uniref:LysR family transcriptional regulator n=1 Tax=Eubacterium maltosivorans TaxID=2041044 RepID=A0A4P9C6M4_EUBML|nr:LysR family transcriptional regulator [Eubacterium maltosivorans]QCT70341.1 LysR family transcriptional regulator [Eubacterium maltosivorans]
MLRQIKYFQAVVRNNSFSEAAEACNISQSAMSQQIQALERELGFQLLERKKRKFELTPSGEYFYKKSIILTADYERICREAAKIAHGDESVLSIGYLRSYNGQAFFKAIDKFASDYSDIMVKTVPGNHEELFQALRAGDVDLVFNDQRRAFSDEYVNVILDRSNLYVGISMRSPFAELKSVTLSELKNTPCVLVASAEQQMAEEIYYRDVIGFQGDFLFAENTEEAKLSVVGDNGFTLTNGENHNREIEDLICHIPLFRGGNQMFQTYCAFWKKEHCEKEIETFVDILKKQF